MHSLINERVISMADALASAISIYGEKMVKLKIYEIDKNYLTYMNSIAEHVFYSANLAW